MFTRLGNRKVWVREDGLMIWLPCDKKTFRIVDSGFREMTTRHFRTLEAAKFAAATLVF